MLKMNIKELCSEILNEPDVLETKDEDLELLCHLTASRLWVTGTDTGHDIYVREFFWLMRKIHNYENTDLINMKIFV